MQPEVTTFDEPGPSDRPHQNRSQRWLQDPGAEGFLRRSALKVQGVNESQYQRPFIGICTNSSDFTRCHQHFDGLVRAVRDGVLAAGGFPRVFNTMVMGADLTLPVGGTFINRNLLAMEIEQVATSYPVDGLVFIGACDETLPAMLMAAASVDLPSIVLPGGPAFSGRWRGRDVGSGFDCYQAHEALQQGLLHRRDIDDLEDSLERSPGHCNTMGTASTMASLTEALGMAPLGSSAIPAVDARRVATAVQVGQRSVQLVEEDLRPSHIMRAASFDNAIRLLAALDGASNAVIHLVAIAGRLGLDLPLHRFDELSRDTPVLANLRPSGEYYMQDFFDAGGVPAVLHALAPLLHLETDTVTGVTLGSALDGCAGSDPRVIGTWDQPVSGPRGIAVLSGNLAPRGAVVRVGISSPKLLIHRGPAVVFDSLEELTGHLEDPESGLDANSVIVLRGEGPRGSLGMAGTGVIPVPVHLLRRGVTDILRVSDTRMGGTAHGTAVLHVTPEAAVGGPIGLVQTGDVIALDVPARTISVEVSDAELERRRGELDPSRFAPKPARGYPRLYADHVLQIDEGCDFDFLRPAQRGSLAGGAPVRP